MDYMAGRKQRILLFLHPPPSTLSEAKGTLPSTVPFASLGVTKDAVPDLPTSPIPG